MRPENISPLLIRLIGEERDRNYKRAITHGQIERGVRHGLGVAECEVRPVERVALWHNNLLFHVWNRENLGIRGPANARKRRSLRAGPKFCSIVAECRWFLGILRAVPGNQHGLGAVCSSRDRRRSRFSASLASDSAGGTLIGGRYLPTDLTTVTVAAGKIVSRPMNGAAEEMIKALEDNRTRTADQAVMGLVKRVPSRGT